jgi:hypothetical protein
MNGEAVRQTEEQLIELNVYLNGRSDILGSSTERSPIAGSIAPVSGSLSSATTIRGGDLSFAVPTFSGPAASILSYSSGSKA